MITTQAFEKSFPGFGTQFLAFCLFLFSFSTILGSAKYNQKCWNFLFKGRSFFGKNTFIFVYCLSIVLGAVITIDIAINIIDISYALMAIPNILAVMILAPKVKKATKTYFRQYVKSPKKNKEKEEATSLLPA